MNSEQLFSIAAWLMIGFLNLRVAWACSYARRYGLPGSDMLAWVGLSVIFLVYGILKLLKGLGWLQGWGGWLRELARQHDLYASRHDLQVIATVIVLSVAFILLFYGIFFCGNVIKRSWLAVGLAGMAVSFSLVRFISLHEMDAWAYALPWAGFAVELFSAGGVFLIAIVRLLYLRDKLYGYRRTF